jgi:hypothetical protein
MKNKKVIVRKINHLEELVQTLQDIQDYISSGVDTNDFTYFVIPSKKSGYFIKIVFNG